MSLTALANQRHSTSRSYHPMQRPSCCVGEYDVAPDGRHFVMIEANEPKSPPAELSAVLNWFAELKRLVPANTESQ